MVRTRVGFSDGAEVVQMDFDARIISYEQLLDVFWKAHNPSSANGSRLYQKAVFYHNPQQQEKAKTSLQKVAGSTGRRVTTTIEPARFQMARNADQKYYLRRSRELNGELSRHYPRVEDLVNSPAATKVNGYLGGNSNQVQFQSYAPKLGLSQSALNALSRYVPAKARHHLPKCQLPGR